MRQCPNCKSDNPDDARFCNYCGMRLPESKEETLYNDLEGLEKARKVEFSDQEIAEESEKVIDEAKKLFEPEWSEEPEENDSLKKQLTIPENLDHMIEEVTREELEQELHRKIKLREQDLKENETPEEEPVEEPTRMIGEDSKEEADEPTRMFTGDIGDFIKKKKDYEDVPEEDAYEEILQSWKRKRKEKKIKREKEGKDPSRVPQFIRDKRSWSDMTTGQKKAVKRIAAGILMVAVFCIIEVYHSRPEAVAERYCKAYMQENWKKAGRLSDLPKNGYVTQDEYVSYMKKNAVTGISGYEIKETNEYEVKLTTINGQNITGNSLEGSFNSPLKGTPNITITLVTDLYADENTFVIRDRNGNIVKEFGPYITDTKATYEETAELELDQIYCFEITDEWGDGMQLPKGSYKIYTSNQSLVEQNFSITGFGARTFFQALSPSSISPIGIDNNTIVSFDPIHKLIEIGFKTENTGKANISIYSITGKCLINENIQTIAGGNSKQSISAATLPMGIYLLNINQDGKETTHKMIIR